MDVLRSLLVLVALVVPLATGACQDVAPALVDYEHQPIACDLVFVDQDDAPLVGVRIKASVWCLDYADHVTERVEIVPLVTNASGAISISGMRGGYGYVRLGEYENLDQLGDETVSPWHNQGHGFLAGTVDPDMGSPSTAIHGKENIFWRWHTRVDNVRAAFRPDKAALASTTPADKAIIKARPAVFVATFASPVSVTPASTEPALNTAQITAGLLTVNGVPATGVTKSADHKTVTFTVAMPASGPVTVAFAGTRSVDSFATSFTITP